MRAKPAVLLVSADSQLTFDLQRIFTALGVPLVSARDEQAALVVLAGMEAEAAPEFSGEAAGILLLDVGLAAVADGRLLATLHEVGARRRFAIALIAEHVSDSWIARLREGAIDDIVPRGADGSAWNTHLNTMQRGHQLFCELEHLRESAQLELEHDRVTGAFTRDGMLSILFRETDRVQRLRGALCLVAFEVDDFERVRSELGMIAGDQLLREVAKRTGQLLRSYDVLGRLGSSRFLLALPGCSTISGAMLAERLRMDVFGELFQVEDGHREMVPVGLTASFGITASRGRSPVVVLREAEEALALGRLAGADGIRSDGICCAGDSETAMEGRRLFSEAEMAGR